MANQETADELFMKIQLDMTSKWKPEDIKRLKTVLSARQDYVGNELNGITHDNCEKLLEMMKDRRDVFKRENRLDYSFLYQALLEADLPNRKEEVEDIVEQYQAKTSHPPNSLHLTRTYSLESSGSTSSTNLNSLHSISFDNMSGRQKARENSGEKRELLSTKVMAHMQGEITENNIGQMLAVLKRKYPAGSKYGANRVSNIKSPVNLYTHMCKSGTICDKPGQEDYSALIETLNDVGADDVATDLTHIIEDHRISAQEKRERFSTSSSGSARSTDTAPPTPLSVSSVSADQCFLSPQEPTVPSLKRRMNSVESVESDGIASSVKKSTPDLKEYLRKLEKYDVANGKGLVAIINNFTKQKDGYDFREGTNEDEERIVAVFKDETFEYYFKVSNPKRDLCYDSMIKYLKELKGDLIKNEKNYSSFTLFILSHGNEKGVVSYCSKEEIKDNCMRHTVEIDKLTSMFDEVLPNKPKVMVIQACKGLQTNTASDDASSDLNNNQVEDDRPFRPTMKPPKSADMLVAYSTVPGYKSFRDKWEGSWFIQLLMDKVESSTRDPLPQHMLDIITSAQNAVSEKRHNEIAQMPYFQSSLRSKFYLLPMDYWINKL